MSTMISIIDLNDDVLINIISEINNIKDLLNLRSTHQRFIFLTDYLVTLYSSDVIYRFLKSHLQIVSNGEKHRQNFKRFMCFNECLGVGLRRVDFKMDTIVITIGSVCHAEKALTISHEYGSQLSKFKGNVEWSSCANGFVVNRGNLNLFIGLDKSLSQIFLNFVVHFSLRNATCFHLFHHEITNEQIDDIFLHHDHYYLKLTGNKIINIANTSQVWPKLQLRSYHDVGRILNLFDRGSICVFRNEKDYMTIMDTTDRVCFVFPVPFIKLSPKQKHSWRSLRSVHRVGDTIYLYDDGRYVWTSKIDRNNFTFSEPTNPIHSVSQPILCPKRGLLLNVFSIQCSDS